MRWHYIHDGNQLGPVEEQALIDLIAAGELTTEVLVWHPGLPQWVPAASVIGSVLPPPVPQNVQPAPEPDAQIEPTSNGEVQSVQSHDSPSVGEMPLALAGTLSGQPTNEPIQSEPTRGRNYFSRHWNGDYSLAVSYWANGFAVFGLTKALGLILPAIFPSVPSAEIVVLRWVLFWGISLTGLTWWWVGAIRSANNHVSRGGKLGWANTAKVMIAIGICGTAMNFIGSDGGVLALGKTLGHLRTVSTFSDYKIELSRNGREIHISGPIGTGISDAFEKLIIANPQVEVVQIDSTGGLIEEAKRIRALIRSRRLTTYSGRECLSAACIVFMGGTERCMGRNAKLGFHRPQFPIPDGPMALGSIADEERYMQSIGISSEFIQKAFSYRGDAMWYPSVEELKQAGVITGLTSGYEFSLTGLEKWGNETELERDLLKTPLYETLKRREPETFTQMKEAIQQTARQGGSVNTLRKQSLPLLVQLLNKRLPRTSDQAIIRFVDVLITQVDQLRAASPELCMSYLFERETGINNDYSIHFKEGVVAEELNAMRDVIEYHDANRRVPTNQEVQPGLQKAFKLVARELGNEGLQMIAKSGDKEFRATTNKAKFCEAMSCFFKSIRKLPKAEAANIIRFMMSQGAKEKGLG